MIRCPVCQPQGEKATYHLVEDLVSEIVQSVRANSHEEAETWLGFNAIPQDIKQEFSVMRDDELRPEHSFRDPNPPAQP